MKPLHIFKPGSHTAMSGVSFDFSESDLAATVAAYDPSLHQAPMVIGHPKHDAPAAGWVKSLTATAQGLIAEPQQVAPAFAEQVAKGTVSSQRFIPADIAQVFLVAHGVLRMFNAPANYNETVRTLGQPFYSKAEERKLGKSWDLEAQANPLAMCLFPEALVELKAGWPTRYCTRADIGNAVPEMTLIQPSNDDPAAELPNESVIEDGARQAEELVDGHLRGRYNLPLDPVPTVLRDAVVYLARQWL